MLINIFILKTWYSFATQLQKVELLWNSFVVRLFFCRSSVLLSRHFFFQTRIKLKLRANIAV